MAQIRSFIDVRLLPVQILQCRSNKCDLCWPVVSLSVLVFSALSSGVFGGSVETSVNLGEDSI